MATVPVEERLLTPEEVAGVARVRLRTVASWRRTGRLVAVPLPAGRLYRFRASDVAAALNLDPAALLAALREVA